MSIIAGYSAPSSQFGKINLAIWEYASPASTSNPALNLSNNPTNYLSSARSSGLKCVATILAPWNSGMNALLKDSTYRAQLIANISNLVISYGFDGVAVDWECDNQDITAAQLTTFYQELRSALGSTKIICTAENYGKVVFETAILNYIDWIGLMIYDVGDPVNNIPWYGTYTQFQTEIQRWIGAGFPANRLVAGISFAARLGIAASGWYSYATVSGSDPNANINNNYYYNGKALVDQKCKYAVGLGLGGIFTYASSFDRTDSLSLLDTIVANMGSSPPPPSGFPAGKPKTALVPVTVVPSGLPCEVEVFLGIDQSTPASTSGKLSLVSTGAVQNVNCPVTMPASPGIYNVYINLYILGSLFSSFVSTVPVSVYSGSVGEPTWP